MRKLDQIDNETGEVLSEGALVWVPKRFPHPYGDRWFAMRMDTIRRLTMHPGIGMQEMRVFGALIDRLDYQNFIHVPQTDLAEATGMDRPHVNRALKKLIEFGIVVEGPRVGRSRCYRFDPDAGWRGSKKTLKAELRAIKGGRDDPASETPAQPNLFPE